MVDLSAAPGRDDEVVDAVAEPEPLVRPQRALLLGQPCPDRLGVADVAEAVPTWRRSMAARQRRRTRTRETDARVPFGSLARRSPRPAPGRAVARSRNSRPQGFASTRRPVPRANDVEGLDGVEHTLS